MNPRWQKSSSCSEGDSCIHAASTTNTIHLTESGDPAHSILGTTPQAFAALIHVLKESPAHV